MAELVALFVNRGDHETHGNADIDEQGFGQLQARFDRLGHGDDVLEGELPRDPAYLSYTLAATCLLTLQERQALLEAASPLERLIMLRHALVEEMRAMRAIPSLPATEVARTSWSPN